MTNREWLESLTDVQLAEFFTHGIMVTLKGVPEGLKIMPFSISIHQIIGSYISSTLGVTKWLTSPQEYEVVEVE